MNKIINIFTKSLLNRFNNNTLHFQKSLNHLSSVSFSKNFDEKDKNDLQKYDDDRNHHPFYIDLRDNWQKPLAKKRKRQERIRIIKANKVEPTPETQKFVVHNPVVGIQYPPAENQIFAVVQILGKQYKVVQDDIVVIDWMKQYDINDHVMFDQVLLVGTQHYTSIGRPLVETAKVYATVEQQTTSSTIEGFKYKRRKQYKRHWGARSKLTVFRIDKIDHQLNEEQFNKAVSLV